MQLIETLGRYVTPEHVARIAAQVGASPEATQQAIGAALPALVSGLSRRAEQGPEGAQALLGLLDRDGDGQVLDDLGALLGGTAGGASATAGGGGLLGAVLGGLGGGGGAGPAGELLEQILGGRRGAVEQGVQKATGLDAGQVAQILALLAPLLLGALAKVQRRDGLDAGGVGQVLQQERRELEQSAGLEGALGRLLDQDGDGSVADDLAAIAQKAVLGGLFGKR